MKSEMKYWQKDIVLFIHKYKLKSANVSARTISIHSLLFNNNNNSLSFQTWQTHVVIIKGTGYMKYGLLALAQHAG